VYLLAPESTEGQVIGPAMGPAIRLVIGN